jgi:hypothetical protein
MLWQEISMRKSFLAQNPTARRLLQGIPAHRIAAFPYGHPNVVALFLSVLSACAIVASIVWQGFVFHTIFNAGLGP